MQGYLTVALDQQKYLDMAANLAKSIRYFDKSRPVCLVRNKKIQVNDSIRDIFDDVVILDDEKDYVGCMNKIRVYDVSPYDETMYIDADCLLAKNDIDRHWNKASNNYFGITGEKCTSGTWNSTSIGDVCKNLAIPYMVRMNSGVFYFKKCDESERFFQHLAFLYMNHRDLISNIHQGRAGQYADEPFLGAAMGKFGVDPVGGEPSEGSWMVSTWRARRCKLEPDSGISSLEKPSRYVFRPPLFPHGWVRHSPTIFHFIGLKPADVYRRAVSTFDRALQDGMARQGVLSTRKPVGGLR